MSYYNIVGHGITGQHVGNNVFYADNCVGVVQGTNIRNVTINGKPVSNWGIQQEELDEFKIVTSKGSYVIKDKALHIQITADRIDQVNLTVGDVDIHGPVSHANSTSGNIRVHGNAGNVSSTSGDVTVSGNISGGVRTTSGDITYDQRRAF